MAFQHAAFLPSLASFSTTFIVNGGSGERVVTTTCLITVVGAKEGHAP